METNDADVFLSSALLGFNESSGSVDAYDKTTCDFWIEGTGVSGFLTAEDSAHPCDYFVGRRVRRFVEVDNTGLDVCLQVTFERTDTGWNRSKMRRPNEQFIVILQQERPLRCIELRSDARTLDCKVALLLELCDLILVDDGSHCHS